MTAATNTPQVKAEPHVDAHVDSCGETPNRIYLYKRYERFWHWSQALLIITLIITGFEIHGTYALLGFEPAIRLHIVAAWVLVVLWSFTLFWHLTTSEWEQYIPTYKRLGAVAQYYVWGIFTGAPHPYKKTVQRKHNPLQRLTYLGLLAFILPTLWVSGILYLFHAQWAVIGLDGLLSLQWVARVHVAAAFLVLLFLIVHVYLTTTGHTPTAHIKTMITGWEDVDEQH
jgi:thiosulfate reductase cytochrome b subunit